MRNTTQRTEILKFLRSKRHHCSAVQIYDAVRKVIEVIAVIVLLIVVFLMIWVYRKPIKNYGKPKARR